MLNVLVVDNDPVLLKAVSTMLTQMGCEVVTAKNGLQAIELLEKTDPDIVFTDLIMPHVGGKQLCKIIKNSKKHAGTFLVILSAVVLEDQEDLTRNIDSDLCIAKGTLGDLRSNLEKALQLYKSKDKQQSKFLGISTEHLLGKSTSGTITSELFAVKEHLSRMITHLSEGVVELTSSGKIVSVNLATLSFFSKTEEQLLGKYIYDLPFGHHLRSVKKWLSNYLNKEKANKYEIYETDPLICADKVGAASFLSIKEGHHSFGIVIFRDITRQYQAEAYNKQMNDALRLMKKMDAMSSMAGGVAHDFNNLLAVICGNLDIITYSNVETTSEEKNKLVLHAQKASYAAADLMKKISCFSTFGIVSREERIASIMVKDLVKQYFIKNDGGFEFVTQGNHLEISVDSDQVKETIYNLLDNSIEAGAKTKIKISIDEEEFPNSTLIGGHYIQKGKYLRVNIEDDGCGIPTSNLMEIFDPYFSTKQRGAVKGMGLGLTVVYATMRNHGGHVVVKSNEGDGCNVSLFFPVITSAVYRSSTAKSDRSESRKHILLLEDEVPLQEVGRIMLEHLGFKVTVVAQGTLAIEQCAKMDKQPENYIAAILNIYGDEGEEGVTVCREIRSMYPDIKTIASSGAILHPVMENCQKYGFDTTLPKPYTLDNLKHALGTILG